jgi:hypothetical protein
MESVAVESVLQEYAAAARVCTTLIKFAPDHNSDMILMTILYYLVPYKPRARHLQERKEGRSCLQ